jgi:hypothetical protein
MRPIRQCFIADAAEVNGTEVRDMDHYFIVGPVQVVTLDLADSISSFDPTARIDCFQASADAAAALDLTRPAVVLLHRDPAGFLATPLGRALDARGIPFAFLWSLLDAQVDGAIVLDSPFSDATVAALLQRLLGKSQQPAAG